MKFSVLRFSLRSLFVFVTAIAVFLGYELNWIQKRRLFLKEQIGIYAEEVGLDNEIIRQKLTDIYVGQHKRPPSMLSLFGESGYTFIYLFLRENIATEQNGRLSVMPTHPTLARARSLFPETYFELLTKLEPGDYRHVVLLDEHGNEIPH
jgi:hypothetical protein